MSYACFNILVIVWDSNQYAYVRLMPFSVSEVNYVHCISSGNFLLKQCVTIYSSYWSTLSQNRIKYISCQQNISWKLNMRAIDSVQGHIWCLLEVIISMAVEDITVTSVRTQAGKLLSVCCRALKSINVALMYLWSADIVCLPYYACESGDGPFQNVKSCPPFIFRTKWLKEMCILCCID